MNLVELLQLFLETANPPAQAVHYLPRSVNSADSFSFLPEGEILPFGVPDHMQVFKSQARQSVARRVCTLIVTAFYTARTIEIAPH